MLNDKKFKMISINNNMKNINEDYESKFGRLGFMIIDLFKRYKSIANIREIDAAEQIPTYRTIIKDNLHKDLHIMKDWLDKKYFSKDETPLGVYIHKKFYELEQKLSSEDSGEQKKSTLINTLSEICDSLPKLKYKMI